MEAGARRGSAERAQRGLAWARRRGRAALMSARGSLRRRGTGMGMGMGMGMTGSGASAAGGGPRAGDARCVRLAALEGVLADLEAGELAPLVDIVEEEEDKEGEDGEDGGAREVVLPRSAWTLKHVLLHVVGPATARRESWVGAGKVADEDLSVPGGGTLVLCSQDIALKDLIAVLRRTSESNEFFWVPTFCAPFEIAAAGPGRWCASAGGDFAARVAIVDDWARPGLCTDLGVVYALKEFYSAKLAVEVVATEGADAALAARLFEAHARVFDAADADDGAEGGRPEEARPSSPPPLTTKTMTTPKEALRQNASWHASILRAVLGDLWALRLEDLGFSAPFEGLPDGGLQEASLMRDDLDEAWSTLTKPMLMSLLMDWFLAALERVTAPEGELDTLADSEVYAAKGRSAAAVVAAELEMHDLAIELFKRAVDALDVDDGILRSWIALEAAQAHLNGHEYNEARAIFEEVFWGIRDSPATDAARPKVLAEKLLEVDALQLAANLSISAHNLVEAHAFLDDALAVAHEVCRPESGRIASLLVVQGSVLWQEGKVHEALSTLRAAARLCELSYGIDDPETAGAQLWLGLALGSLDHWQQAVELCEVAVAHQESCFGQSSLVRVCDAQQILAGALFDAGERGRALALSESAQQRVEEILEGTKHPARIFHLRSLAALQSRLHLWKPAANAYERALELLEAPPRDSRFAALHVFLLGRLALTYGELGESQRAEELLARAQNLHVYFSDNVVRAKKEAQHRCLFGAVYLHIKSLRRSLEELDQASSLVDKCDPRGETRIARSRILTAQAYVYSRLRCAVLACGAYRETRTLLMSFFEDEPHHLLVQVNFLLARCYSDNSRIRDLGQALRYGQEGFSMARALTRGQPHPMMARAQTTMAALFARSKNSTRALEHLRAGIDVLQALPDWSERDLGLALTRLGVLERSVLRAPTKALATFASALEHLDKEQAHGSPTDVSEVLMARAKCYHADCRFVEALEDYRRVAEIREAARGKRDAKLAEAYLRISEVLEAQGKPAEALEFVKRASRITKKHVARVRVLADQAGLAEAAKEAAAEGEDAGHDGSDMSDSGSERGHDFAPLPRHQLR